MRTESLIASLALIGASAAFEVGCVAHASAAANAEVDAPVVFVEPPTLVLVDSDVWVVRDYDYPVYYYGDYYWVYRDNVWYQSRAYDRGWVTVEVSVVPGVIVHRDHHAYVHFHGSASARTRSAPRDYAAAEPRREQEHKAEPPKDHGPPEHSAAYGGPPGHNDPPGVGNQRKAAEGEAVKSKKYDKKKQNNREKEDKKHGD